MGLVWFGWGWQRLVGIGRDLLGFGRDWLCLVGFGCVCLGLVGIGRNWLCLVVFGWVCLGFVYYLSQHKINLVFPEDITLSSEL